MRDSASHLISLLGVKIAMNLRAEATKNQLGYAWWLLEPILETAVFYLVFGIFLSGGTENFIAFLLTGLIPWTWFSRSVSNSMMSLKNASWLLNNFRLNPVFFPLVELGQDAFKQLATFGFLLSFLFLYGVEPADSWIWLPGVMLLQMLLVASIGCCVAAFIPLLEDLKYLIATTLLATMFASGIFYDPQVLVTAQWTDIYYLNPVASLLQLYRDVLMYGKNPEIVYVRNVMVWTLVFSLLATVILNYFTKRYARLIVE
jgi:lipopolysaccharide transport system permease protein